ncbi:MAG TPA: bifunctional phosphopantothenoylcysteine decarboxylase/phosphopantothenate--cysteine ligase CoaBC [Methylibium sp.]|uniref:bifunctional phosphopantothenoylcysteine decarboxylase/phosphopantothenate--cysteine ligase CoaBC n=1 Tax=Methylibium sp. TaxID=2067992 RepID=UPI002DBBD5CB|nr:bifunctional phosphopantothenoylcysteine decarboxylase/phosphopantothenate--cysteine ligase CoaBC [Methylibium sp.]HEU4459384.1 bifunctional phosphopantothenoylcysteine decarboxylase/phosphopantothenate--cysteine ligase CoaBC [Methylibium sp.]
MQDPAAASLKDLAGKRLVLGLSGGIACYKAAELLRLFVKAGAEVQVVMTAAAQQFITVATMQALSGRPVLTDTWDESSTPDRMPHIHATRAADAIVVAPASADFIARLAQGRADELLGLMCLARPIERCALLVAPAMNREMWSHPATQRNLAQITADGAVLLGVGSGAQACGEYGDGRMLEAAELLDDVTAFLSPKPLAGDRVLITAGPTFEAIDPVRGLTNRSSGKMGFALARAAREAGAQVTLVAGPVHLPTPRGVTRLDVQSAEQMLKTVLPLAADHGIFIATAAVADWRPKTLAPHKIKKEAGNSGKKEAPSFELTENTDILAAVAALPRAPFCVGFAAESENLAAHARRKLEAKRLPLVVGNLGPQTFGRDENALLLVDANGEQPLPADGGSADKLMLARLLVAEIARRRASIRT